MFKSLRARSLASHVLVALVCLTLSTASGVLWLDGPVREPGPTAPGVESTRDWRAWALPVLGVGALALAVAALAGHVLSHSIAKPLEAMTRAAQQVADGRRDLEIAVGSDDEIGRLGQSLNRMAAQIGRANRVQRELVTNITHDLQTPLTSIRGFSQAIVDGSIRDAHGLRRAGQIISEEASRMAKMINDLLDLAKLEAGQAEMARVPIELGGLLASCVDRFAPRARAAGLQLLLEMPESLPSIQGDPDRLDQAFSNLLDNAIKFSSPGGRVLVNGYSTASPLKSSARPRKPEEMPIGKPPLGNGQWVVITVTDTGAGIPEEELDRIFERFYRADKARSGPEGAGLGLPIAREIVEAHGGAVTVASHPGQGSQFSVALPAS